MNKPIGYKDRQLTVLREALRKIAMMHQGWASCRMALVRERAMVALNEADDIGRAETDNRR